MQDPTDPTRKQTTLEQFLQYVPGFRGYLEREERRESDAEARRWLADQLDRAKRALASQSQTLVAQGQIDALPQVDRLRARLDKLIARIRGAMRGYSGFFDRVQIDADALERIYLHDLDLMQHVDELVHSIEQLPQDQLPQALADFHPRLDQLDRELDARDQMLQSGE